MKAYQRKLDIRNGCVDLSHGSGGRAMAQLISGLFHEAFGNEWLARGNDQSAFDVGAGRMVMTTDGYVVSPLFFPGGNIGSLAVHGTVKTISPWPVHARSTSLQALSSRKASASPTSR
ncbi:hypothetical protein ACVWZW_004999 [Bradyrhizobium sp. F1.13.4]